MASNLIGLLTEGMAGDELKAQGSDLNPESKALMNRQYKKAMESKASDYSDPYKKLAEMPAIHPELEAESMTRGMAASGGGNVTQAQAIANRSRSSLGRKLSQMSRKADLIGMEEEGRQLQKAYEFSQAQEKVRQRMQEQQIRAYEANQAARSAALKSVLGLGGMIGGAIIAGPAGAAVGGKVAGGGSTDPALSNYLSSSKGTQMSASNRDINYIS